MQSDPQLTPGWAGKGGQCSAIPQDRNEVQEVSQGKKAVLCESPKLYVVSSSFLSLEGCSPGLISPREGDPGGCPARR